MTRAFILTESSTNVSRGLPIVRISSADTLPHPIRSLREDHYRAISLIRMLVERIGGLVRLGPDDLRIAEGVMRYMVEFIDRHHHAREDLVIEALGRRDASLRNQVSQSGQDHHELRVQGLGLLETIAGLRTRRSAWVGSLLERLTQYMRELEEHFSGEETELFAPAARILRPGDWQRIEAAREPMGDPLFGDDVEEEFRELFQIYVSQVREIGVPAAQTASAAAAAAVDGAAAAIEGARDAVAILRLASSRAWQANVGGANAVWRSRNWFERVANISNWYWNVFDETVGAAREFGDTLSDAARSSVEPFGQALSAQGRQFEGSHRVDSRSPSWQVQLMNLGLRATIKRMAGRGTLDDIRTPRSNFDRFIPALADDIVVETADLGTTFAEIFSIRGAEPDRTVLHCPGGGFVMAPTQAHRLLAGRLARRLNARVMLVHYRVAPEHPFPAGLDDCVRAYDWLLTDGAAAGPLILSGDSAGGGIALSTALRIRDAGKPLPVAITLMSPVTDLSYSGQSRHENRWVDPSLPNDESNLMARIYLGEVPQNDPLASPLFADLSGLPPVLVQVGSTEVLLDDSLRVAAKIRARGGVCECEVWHDMPHDWMLFGMLPESRRALRRIVSFIDKVTERVPVLVG